MFLVGRAGDAGAAKLCCSVFPPEPPPSQGTLGEQFAGIGGVAVNVAGNGPGVTPGDIYVVDRSNNRVQQLHEIADGSGHRFVRAFGFGVGGVGVNVCTVAASCQAGAPSDSAGGMSEPIGVAVDQVTGNVYVSDNSNRRIDVFRADGVFEGAFGWKVDATAPLEALQFCTAVTGCQAGSAGGGAGQFGEPGGSFQRRGTGGLAVAPAGAPDAGNLVVADSTNNRVDEFGVSLNPGKEVTGVGFVGGYGWNVNVTTPEAKLQTCTTVSGCKAGSIGGGEGQFSERGLIRVAVDSTGAIYALNTPNVVNPCNTTTRPCSVQKINPARTAAPLFAPTRLHPVGGLFAPQVAASEIVVDPASGDVYVARPSGSPPEVVYQIERFDSLGNPLETYPSSGGIGPNERTVFGLAFDNASGNLYLTSTTGGQRIFLLTNPPSTPPTVVTGGAGAGANFAVTVLEGSVNPEGFRVLGCRFEYGTTTAYGTSTPCVPGEPGEGVAPVTVSAETEPLAPSTTYHYRLAAENGGPIGFGVDRTFTTGPAPKSGCPNEARRIEQGVVALLLPDCMALEMVSPPKKAGQAAILPSVSADGSRAKFVAQAALGEDPPPLVALLGSTYVATRGSSGWTPESTVPRQGFFKIWQIFDERPSFTPDFSRWFGIGAGAVEIQRGITHVYEAGLGNFFKLLTESPLTPLFAPGSSEPPRNVILNSVFQGASADRSHFYFRPGASGTTFLPGDPNLVGTGAEGANTYLARLSLEGQPEFELMSRDYTGKVWGGSCGARLGGFGPASGSSLPARNGERTQGAISADGARAYLSARAAQPQSGDCLAANKLRILERLETVAGPEISPLFSSECNRATPACKTEGEANGDDLYQGASLDGSRVYFTSNRQLANSDLDGTNEECKTELAVNGCDLYLYDRARPPGERLIQVSAGEELGATHEKGKGARVYNGVPAISGDGSHVYFVAEGVLTDHPNLPGPGGAIAQAGKPNLYLWDADTEATSFIGTLDLGDAIGDNQFGKGMWGGQGTWRNDAYPVPVTRKNAEGEEVGDGDGHILFFETQAALTGEDADGQHLDVYRYDSEAEPPTLKCLSCRPPGPDSAPFSVGDHGETGPGGTDFAEEGRWVSEDGGTAGFLTSESLLPGDVNGAPDFYLWRDGTLARLPGKPSVSVANNGPFLSHDGSTVAFATQSALLPQDGDTTSDVYVARVDGGFQIPPLPPVCLPGDGSEPCQGTQAAPPAPRTGSEAVSSGNPPWKRPCGKGKVRRHGRCVPRHSHKKHAKKKHRARHAKADRRGAR